MGGVAVFLVILLSYKELTNVATDVTENNTVPRQQ